MAKKLKITLIKSVIASNPKNRRIVENLGFTKLHQTIIRPDDAAMRGAIAHISHMVKVEEIEE
ncbi:MAG: 50S ribosomal protein L30 [Firmicutes bacterium]|jgi:large subunit ribosomal protein L30|nr:50S ribosomal protein L30 [Bacillota bacterium]